MRCRAPPSISCFITESLPVYRAWRADSKRRTVTAPAMAVAEAAATVKTPLLQSQDIAVGIPAAFAAEAGTHKLIKESTCGAKPPALMDLGRVRGSGSRV